MVGVCGHGDIYLNGLLSAPPGAGFRFTAAIDPNAARCPRLDELKARGVRIYGALEAFYAVDHADLLVMATPPFLHCRQTAVALSHGSHVFCEKPLATHPQQIPPLLEARRKAQRLVAIGYQWSFSPAIQALKSDIAAGRLGQPRRFKSLVLWPRSESYYRRNQWAGRIRDDRGNWLCDSPLNNACAHDLHNMFYLLGAAPDRSAFPASVTAELYRAYDIENYDTAALSSVTEGGVQVLCVVSHVTEQLKDPVFCLECDEATVTFDAGAGTPITAEFRSGRRHTYGFPHDGYRLDKLWQMMDAIRQHMPVVCGIEAAASQTACIWAAQQSGPIAAFPRESVHHEGECEQKRRWVKGLAADLERCYQQWRLPAELCLPWSEQAHPISAESPLPLEHSTSPSLPGILPAANCVSRQEPITTS